LVLCVIVVAFLLRLIYYSKIYLALCSRKIYSCSFSSAMSQHLEFWSHSFFAFSYVVQSIILTVIGRSTSAAKVRTGYNIKTAIIRLRRVIPPMSCLQCRNDCSGFSVVENFIKYRKRVNP